MIFLIIFVNEELSRQPEDAAGVSCRYFCSLFKTPVAQEGNLSGDQAEIDSSIRLSAIRLWRHIRSVRLKHQSLRGSLADDLRQLPGF